METNNGHSTYSEIQSQPRTWEATLSKYDALHPDVLQFLQDQNRPLVFIGCGSTYYLSLSAAASWQTITDSTARGVPSSELWLFPKLVLRDNPRLFAISRSGETSETILAIDTYKRLTNQKSLGITCYPQSIMAKDGLLTLLTDSAQEDSVAQTRSFSSMYLLVQQLAGIISNKSEFLIDLCKTPHKLEKLVALYEPLIHEIAVNPNIDKFVFLGSGPLFGLASEAMLKMKEMSLSISEVFHFLEFRHGPKSVVGPGTMIIGLVSETSQEHELKVLSEMRRQGAKTLAILENGGSLSSEIDTVIELKSGIQELARSVLYLPLLQLLAYYRSMYKGLNPDRPENLDAVVRF